MQVVKAPVLKTGESEPQVREIAIILARDIVKHLDMRHMDCGGGEIGSVFSTGAYCLKCMRNVTGSDMVAIIGMRTKPTMVEFENPFERQ